MRSTFVVRVRRWLAVSFPPNAGIIALPESLQRLWPHLNGGRTAAVGAVLALHVLVAAIFFLGLTRQLPPKSAEEVHLTLSPPTDPVRRERPEVVDPSLPVLEPPQIVIQSDDDAQQAIFASAPMVMAPRPDPAQPNVSPTLSSEVVSSAGKVVVLKILVMPNGTIGDTSIVRSSGASALDSNLAAFVKANWHYLPAMLNDAPVQYWTTISIAI